MPCEPFMWQPQEALLCVTLDDFQTNDQLLQESQLADWFPVPSPSGDKAGSYSPTTITDKSEGLLAFENLPNLSCGHSPFGNIEDDHESCSSMLDNCPLHVADCISVAEASGASSSVKATSDQINTVAVDNASIQIQDKNQSESSTTNKTMTKGSTKAFQGRKRPQVIYDDDDDDEEIQAALDAKEYRFHDYQADMWNQRLHELLEFRKKTGHCRVPFTYTEHPLLARWVKRQRYQYKLQLEGKRSTMTPERIKTLEEIGFVWDSQEAAWWDRFADLVEYKDITSNCNVPSRYRPNPQLSIWVKCQRRQYRFYKEGKPTNMTAQRIRDLESIGFQWMIRSYHKLKKK